MEKVGDLNLFKFSESLQQRMELLLEKKKADLLIGVVRETTAQPQVRPPPHSQAASVMLRRQ